LSADVVENGIFFQSELINKNHLYSFNHTALLPVTINISGKCWGIDKTTFNIMESKRFNIMHPNDWKVLKVRQFNYKRGNIDTTGTILYDRPYKYGGYVGETNDVVDATIDKAIQNLFGEIVSYGYDIICEKEIDDYVRQYCEGKTFAHLTVRCMPQLELTPQTADTEEPIVGYDLNFKVYLDFVQEGAQILDVFTLSSFVENKQEPFDRATAVLKEY
jgi:hypothetical protein